MFLKHNLYGFAWALLIFILCLIPGKDIPDWNIFTYDKAGHAVMFAVLVFLFNKGFIKQHAYSLLQIHPMKAAILISVVYGGLLEIMQDKLIPDRTGDIMDFFANTIGCFAGAGISGALKKKLYLR